MSLLSELRRLTVLVACGAASLQAQSPASTLSVERIFRTRDFAAQGLPYVQWMNDGRSYLSVKADGGAMSLVRVNVVTGAETVLLPSGTLKDETGKPIDVEDVTLSADETKALIFHSSVRVVRITLWILQRAR
jgi:hypothetical protein